MFQDCLENERQIKITSTIWVRLADPDDNDGEENRLVPTTCRREVIPLHGTQQH